MRRRYTSRKKAIVSPKIRCWEFFNCKKKGCPVYKSKTLRCWLVSGTYCRKGIQGDFIEKIEMCAKCKVVIANMDGKALKETFKIFNEQFKAFRNRLKEVEDKLESINIELSVSLSEVFEALKKISSGDPTIRIEEDSKFEFIKKLKHLVNLMAENIGEIVDQSHEFAIALAEHFDVLQRVTKGDLNARVTGISNIELIEALKELTNKMITSRKETEDSLRQIEELEASILSAIPHAVIGLKERVIFFVNQAVEKVFGWKPEELIGKKTRILYRSDEECEEIAQIFYPILERQKIHVAEFPCRKKDGRDIICKVSASVIGQELKDRGIVVVYEDITEHKKMEKALKESEQKYLDLYQNAPDGYHSLGLDGTILEVNDTWLRLFGYKREEVIGRKFTELLNDDAKKMFEETFTILKEKGFVENIDYGVKKKDGSLLPVLINATAIYDSNGNFLRSRAIVRDNSEKKNYEKKLKESAEEWRTTFDSMPYGVILLDADLNIIRANRYVTYLLNINFSELINKNITEFFMDAKELLVENSKKIKERKIRTPIVLEYYHEQSKRYLMFHLSPIYDEDGLLKHIIFSLVDISELKDKEKRLSDSKEAFLNMLKEIDASYKDLQEIFNGLIHSFVNAMDAKSNWTKGHSERVTNYALSIAKEMDLNPKDIERLRIASLLHDIGKIGTYDVILDKPEKLSEEEAKLIKLHPVKGEEILRPIAQLKDILPIIRHHHERMDGKGYPDGLEGEAIPFLSRIIAVADAFDSMTSDRPYRPAPPIEYAISEIKRCSGTQFDPEVAKAFLNVLERVHNSLQLIKG